MRLRAPVPTDAEAVLGLLAERDVADIGMRDITLEDLHDEWRGETFDLPADARVVEAAGGRIVGYGAMSAAEVTILVAVAPKWEGRGIGTCLRAWAEPRDRERGTAKHRQWIASGNIAARALLLAAGYRPERSYWRLSRSLAGISPLDRCPAGIVVRSVEADADASVLHALNETSFAASPDHEPYSCSSFVATHLRTHDFDPDLSCVAETGGRPVAFLLARRWGDRNAGFVDLLAVHPDHRGRGLGAALLHAAFARFAAAGLHEAQLGVASDNPKALRLYARCGMTELFRYDTYDRDAAAHVRIRSAAASENAELEDLQRRASNVWEQYRDQLAAHPDAIELPQSFIQHGWVRVAVTAADVPLGFSVVIPNDDGSHELDGLFVEPGHQHHGIGRALIEDVVARASASGARRLEVTAGPARGFYERTGFDVAGVTETRFGPAVRMRREIRPV